MAALVCASLALTVALLGRGTVAASGQSSSEEDTFQTDAAIPATDVTVFGASPEESQGETWGIGAAGQGTQSYVIVRYEPGEGWTRAPALLEGSGQPLPGFVPAKSVLAGQMAPGGAGALAGFAGKSEVILARNPGQPFQETSPEPVPEAGSEPLLDEGEQLFSSRSAPLMVALDEGAAGGVLVAPSGTAEAAGVEPAVLHWEGQAHQWTREPIELPAAAASEGGFQPLAIGASSPANAWLLAHISSGADGVSLFRRNPGSGGSPATWQPVSPGGGEEAGAPLTVGGKPVTLEPETGGQALTVTESGVWVDGERGATKRVTLFFEPAGAGADAGKVAASWCNAGEGEEKCTYGLPEDLPSGAYRSFAWPSRSSAEPYGQRVITGLPNGVILRLQGDEFARIVTVGSPEAPNDVGGSRGAAFSNAYEGWLGNDELAVHATLEPAPGHRLAYWPVPFDKPVLAIAPEPGVPIGAISSEALAVGERGEVARYVPGDGWQPESLFNVAGGRAEPQLRGVAWPTVNRAYAIGINASGVGEMWLWRGETGLWEKDPATPINFRANLLGIAFAPGEPSRGYAVGQSGALLRYGKTWTQERSCEGGVPQPCLPPEVVGASFTAVAFAGSEALVAYRVPHVSGGAISYTGGLLVNSGSGWHVDTSAASALGAGYVPWAVAGLPDGGAALSASVPGGQQEPVVLERNSPAATWEATPVPYPGFEAPASLALFREGGTLRVVGSGAIPNTLGIDNVTPPPAGFPPSLLEPYPPGLATGIMRQTATSWSDEEPERELLRPPPGGYVSWDIPYSPDPTAAILLNETGTGGWAVGGLLHVGEEGADSADIARYPAEGGIPPGVGTSAVQLELGEGPKPEQQIPLEREGDATFAVGGNGQCAAPCADLANEGIGPDVWLSSVLAQAGKIAGVRDFLYTGPRVTTGETAARSTLAIPYAHEFERYADVLAAGRGSMPVAVVAASTDRVHGSLCLFEGALGEFSMRDSSLGEHDELEASKEPCEAGQAAYYAFTSSGPPAVRVIVLDDSGGVGPTQLAWLEGELKEASKNGRAAIVVGSANIVEEAVVKHEQAAIDVREVLIADGASAYLFDDPEENVKVPLSSGPEPIFEFGSGTLGYVNARHSEEKDFIGANGFLLVVVETSKRDQSTNRAPVIARLIPAVGELSLDAQGGALLHRSQAVMFSALARRPRAGGLGKAESSANQSANFVPIPSNCEGGDCEEGIFPEYTFTSSDPEVGQFVKPNLRSAEADAVELAHEEPIADSKSGLFCAYNAGVTKVKISTGGFYAELPVTVEAGSVRRPCGTTRLKSPPAKGGERPVAAPPPAEAAPGGSPSPAPILPVPPPPAAHVVATPVSRVAVVPPFVPPPSALTPLTVFVPPPLPASAEPTPPSGTSAVEAVQREEEEEEATESVSAKAVAYRQVEHEPSPLYLLGLIVLAAFAGASTRRRPRRGEREVRVAPATLSTTRSQRHTAPRPRRPW
jgi:hypothetical protein